MQNANNSVIFYAKLLIIKINFIRNKENSGSNEILFLRVIVD